MKLAIATLLAAFLAFVSAQHPPTISEVFHAKINFVVHDQHGNFSGQGVWAEDQPNGKSLEHFDGQYDHKPYTLIILERFDLKEGFEVSHEACHTWKLQHRMPELWDWIKRAEFKGKKQYNGKACELWESTHGYASLSILVEEGKSIPVWFKRETHQQVTTVEFVNFEAKVSPDVFAVPKACNNATSPSPAPTPSVGCVARNGMISRAQNWVNHHVPYNQQGHYDGYREDCSGYVSMAWELSKPGYVTSTLPQVSHQISKNDLKPGDCLLNVAEHVVLFGGWADSSRAHYVAYEETRPGEGTVKRVTPYPYWYSTNLFRPYRYNNAC